MADSFSLRVFTPILAGQDYVADITRQASDWRRSIRSVGGPWLGTLTLRGDLSALQRAFYQWLGYHIEERAAGVTWEGMVYEAELEVAGVRRVVSLDTLYNYVSITYIDQDNQIQRSSAAQDTDSIAKYGRREEQLSGDDLVQASAEALRDSYLKEYKLPWPRPTAISQQRGEPFLRLKVAGYIHTLNWRFVTQTTELDSEQGNLTYRTVPDRFSDDGQDFSAWQTTAGNAYYSIYITNSDSTVTWAYLSAASTVTNPNDTVAVYQDQALTTAGWNGTAPAGKTPSAYYIFGPASEWIADIITNDSEFLNTNTGTGTVSAGINDNLLQVKRALTIPDRAGDVIADICSWGDSNGDPWRFSVNIGRSVLYEQISTTPEYYIINGGVYAEVAARRTISPWIVKPGVFRDRQYPLTQGVIPSAWLADQRDIFVEEVEASMNGGLTLKPRFFSESEILATQKSGAQT